MNILDFLRSVICTKRKKFSAHHSLKSKWSHKLSPKTKERYSSFMLECEYDSPTKKNLFLYFSEVKKNLQEEKITNFSLFYCQSRCKTWNISLVRHFPFSASKPNLGWKCFLTCKWRMNFLHLKFSNGFGHTRKHSKNSYWYSSLSESLNFSACHKLL